MKIEGKEDSEWGVKVASDGYHVIEFGDQIDVLKTSEGNIVEDKNGSKCYKFPAKVNDENDPDNGFDLSILVYANKAGEYKVADIIKCIGEVDFFEKRFPGDRSFFEDEIFNSVKIKVPQKFVRVKKETTNGVDKQGNPKKYGNIVKLMSLKVPIEVESTNGVHETKAPANKTW